MEVSKSLYLIKKVFKKIKYPSELCSILNMTSYYRLNFSKKV